MRILMVFGTRPEAVKMCPLALEFMKNKSLFDVKICLTGQHNEMLSQVMSAFNLEADYNLNVMTSCQTLTSITTSILERINPILVEVSPDLVLVHGDTTTALATALACFYEKIPVGHVEAGLRTYDVYSPFPEEMNRQLIDQISFCHFAPTELNKNNLLKQGIDKNVFVTGNTVIDAFEYTVAENYHFENEPLAKLDFSKKKVILVTAHRRENLGKPLSDICNAIKCLAQEFKNFEFVYPVHLNPLVSKTAHSILSDIENVKLISPISVIDMHNLISRCYLVLTDSGGLQEEAPHFGNPVLGLRIETERPEAVKAGTVKVVGTENKEIVGNTRNLILSKECYQKMSKACNPYGDGFASKRIATIIKELNFC